MPIPEDTLRDTLRHCSLGLDRNWVRCIRMVSGSQPVPNSRYGTHKFIILHRCHADVHFSLSTSGHVVLLCSSLHFTPE
jgi:hypothetical protein